jgi:uncharacterized protein YybS (DUF2232 family)
MSTAADARERQEPRSWGALGGAALVALIFSTGMVVPPLGIVSFLALSPIAVQRLRGAGHGVVAVFAATALIGSLWGLDRGLTFLLLLGLPGLLMGEAMIRGYGLRRGWLWASALVSVEIVLGLLVRGREMGAFLAETTQLFHTSLLSSMARWSTADRVEQQAEQLRAFASQVPVIYPALYIVGAALFVTVNAVIVHAYLSRRDPAWLDGSEFEGVRMPFLISVPFVIAGFSAFVPVLQPAAYNALVILGFLLALQGFAIVLFYARRLAVPPMLRVAAVLVIFVSPAPDRLLALLGLFDLWFDFRRFAEVPEGPK